MPDMTEENTPEEPSELFFFSSAKDHVRSSVLQSRLPEKGECKYIIIISNFYL